METLKIFRISEKYVRYLNKIDPRVQHNKGSKRPYVGVVLTVGSFRYFVPMESPKPNHKNMKKSVHIMQIAGGQYGILGFNNMIPVPASEIISFDIDNEPDRKYAELLKRQASFINGHKSDVLDRASKTYFLATTRNKENFFVKVCCDFKRLESACKKYNPNYKPKRAVSNVTK